MPTYDYVCSACGHRLEVVHGINGHGPEACPVCGGPMRKAFVVPTVHFKGSGWAKKDRGAAASTKAAARAGGDAPAGDTSSDTSGDTSGDASDKAADRPAKTEVATKGGATGAGEGGSKDTGSRSTKSKTSSGGDD